ncbi:TetR family transcriptional regulator [Nocardia asiatica]|uniref:TetR/AcrR family transcriptional regulator n=1 Tax=Nocardia asiatica TaxID=209252 RepID=UPI003EE18565
MEPTRRAAAQTKEHILVVARELFYRQGIRATGVDRVAAEAEVAPPTLYRIFGSKDDLVAAYLEREDRHYREWFTAAASGDGPRERILALFEALAEQVRPETCRGCPFLIALGEFPDHELLGHQHAVAMKTWVRAQFGILLERTRLHRHDSRSARLGRPADVGDGRRLRHHPGIRRERPRGPGPAAGGSAASPRVGLTRKATPARCAGDRITLPCRPAALGTPHSALGTPHSGPGTRDPALGTRDPALGTRHSALGTRHSGPGTPRPTPRTADDRCGASAHHGQPTHRADARRQGRVRP